MVPLSNIPWHNPKTDTPFMIGILRGLPLKIYPGSRHHKGWPDFSEYTRWSSLVPGRAYIVAAKSDGVDEDVDDDDDDGIDTIIWATAILQFVRYVRVSEEVFLERKGHIDVQEQQQKDRCHAYRHETGQFEDDAFLNRRLMAWWVPEFASISDSQTTFMIDAFSPTTPFPSVSHQPVRVCIHDIHSATRYNDLSDPWAAGILRDVAAMRIQRAWRAAVASPYTRVGTKRLLNEYQVLQATDVRGRARVGHKAPRMSYD